MGTTNYKINENNTEVSTSKLIYLTYSKYENDWNSFLHTHPFTELFLVTGGEGSFLVEGKEYPLSKHDFVVVNPNTEHTEKSSKEHPLEYIILGVENFSFSFHENTNHLLFNCSSYHQDLISFMNTMLLEKEDSTGYSDQICQNLLEIIIIKLLRITNLNFDTAPSEKINSACLKLKKFIDTNYASKISIDDLANLCHLNKYYLIHSFNKYFGCSPINYLCLKRIEISKELLTNSDLSISEIAKSSGFSSQSYFAQSFLKLTGLSPREYRNSLKKKVIK